MLFNAPRGPVPVASNDASDRADGVGVGSAFERVLEGLAFAHRPFREAARIVERERNLGPRGARILKALSTGLVHPSQLSDALGVGRNLISMDLARLTRAKMVRARQSRADGRRSEIELTSLGVAIVERLSEEALLFITRQLADHSSGEIVSLAGMLRKIGGRQLDE